MTLLRGSIIALIALIGVSHSQDLIPHELLNPVGRDGLGYRPWEKNDTSATWISLAQMGIETLNSLFRIHMNNLEWLVMDGNRITSIPSAAFEFSPELTYISLARNQIRQFEAGAFDFVEKLQVLDLDQNPILNNFDTSLISSLPALQSLYLRYCQLSYFNLPEHMNTLSHLYLSGNVLQVFYSKNESALTHLLLENNRLSYVSLEHFESLIYLDLSGNWLDKVMYQSRVTPANYLHTLNQVWYYRKTTHSALYLDYAPALEYLVLSSNKISEIASDSFLETESLIYVDLSRNEISAVHPGTFNNLLQLEVIILDSNQIRQINYRVFVNLPNLKTISFKNNRIDEIDEDAFTKLNSSANEVSLYLDNNNIHTLKSGSFSGITGLRHIGLSNNRIKTIVSLAFVDLPNLESIVIENQLRAPMSGAEIQTEVQDLNTGYIDSYAFSNLPNLSSIAIRGNEFTDIEAQAFDALPKLTMLDLSNNSLQHLSPEAFRDLPKIESLLLSSNFLSTIAPGTLPKQLKHLDLSRNNKCPDFSCWHIGELHQLNKLYISGIIDQFTIEDLAMFPSNLTVVV